MKSKYRPGDGFRFTMCGIGLLLLLITGLFDWLMANSLLILLSVGLIGIIVISLIIGHIIHRSVVKSKGEEKAKAIDNTIFWIGIITVSAASMIIIRKCK